MRLGPQLDALAGQAIAAAHGVTAPASVRPADPLHGDYQVNGVMALAKELKRPPRELAQKVSEEFKRFAEIETAEVAGPGFINLRLSIPWLSRVLTELAADSARDGVPEASPRQRVVVDYSGPNVAKQMHVGHVRSTLIGGCVYRVLGFLGHHVTGDNHLGDWGKQFGLLLVGMRRFGDEAALSDQPVLELERVYKLANAEAGRDPAFAESARAELAKLQKGDPENLALWRRFMESTRRELEQTYARLDVRFDLWRGESAYEAMLPGVVERLLESGIARRDQGAVCVFFEDDPALSKVKTPFVVQKGDGAFLYSTTDIATVLYRRDELQAERAIYVVDQRQKLHFQQLFATVRKLGVTMQLEHVGFGSVLGPDGTPFKARAGDVIKLGELLDEAEQRAARLFQEEALEVDPERAAELARAVGIGAVKYADLSQNRLSDYRFDWDKLISLKGNSGPYLQYAHARIQAIFRKGEVDPTQLDVTTPLSLREPAEIALGKDLLRFADVVYDCADGCLPHLLCDHLYGLARAFSSFYEQCPVLKAESEVRRTRLLLCWLTARQLRRGLGLLGIAAPERM